MYMDTYNLHKNIFEYIKVDGEYAVLLCSYASAAYIKKECCSVLSYMRYIFASFILL